MKTIVAETVMLGREAFETLGEVEVIPDRQIGPEHLTDADALVIRSKTKVTPELIADSPVRFIGTATAGFEHIDFQTLKEKEISWTASPGCNADSVGDYITTALLNYHTFKGVIFEGKTIGIIGVGQVGSRVAKRAEALGLHVLLNDPPRAAAKLRRSEDSRAEREFDASLLLGETKSTCDFVAGPTIGKNAPELSNDWKNSDAPDDLVSQSPENRHCRFQTLETLLAESDIVTMHVPLISKEPWPTLKMANRRFFEQMKPGSVFINASRGKVLDADALLQAKANGIVSYAILDVWNPEPQIRADVLAAADLGTPHIAGHSMEGKLNGTVQVYDAACRFFGKQPVWDPAPLLPPVEVPELTIGPHGKTDNEVLAEAVAAVYDIQADQLSEADIPRFDELRANYWVRREFKNTRVILTEERTGLMKKLIAAGFSH